MSAKKLRGHIGNLRRQIYLLQRFIPKAPSTRTRVNLKPGKYFHGYAYRPHVTG